MSTVENNSNLVSPYIFLTFKHISDSLKLAISEKKEIRVMDRDQYLETASDKIFNESKFIGMICLQISKGLPVVINGAESFMSKKGKLSLSYHIMKRLGPIPYKLVFIEDEGCENDSQVALREWATTNAEIISVKEFIKLDLSIVKKDPIETKVTCGFLTRHIQDEKVVTGHVTCGYGVGLEEVALIHENNAQYKSSYRGELIELTVDNKFGGTIILISDLSPLSHVTNNTSIKSVLSGPILQKYVDGVMEFQLKDIDPNAKDEKRIRIEKIGVVDVMIIGWYTYVISL